MARQPGQAGSIPVRLRHTLDAAHAAAGGRDVEVLGADLAARCLRRGLVDEVLVHLLPALLGDGVRSSPPGAARVELGPYEVTRSGPVTLLRPRVRRWVGRAAPTLRGR